MALAGLHRLETAYTQWSRAWIAVSLRPFRANRGFGAPAASREAIPFPAQALGDRFEIAQDRFADALLSQGRVECGRVVAEVAETVCRSPRLLRNSRS